MTQELLNKVNRGLTKLKTVLFIEDFVETVKFAVGESVFPTAQNYPLCSRLAKNNERLPSLDTSRAATGVYRCRHDGE